MSNSEPALISTDAVAALTKASRRAVQNWAAEHGVARFGRSYAFTAAQVEAFQQRKTKPGPAPLPEGDISASARAHRRRRNQPKGDETG